MSGMRRLRILLFISLLCTGGTSANDASAAAPRSPSAGSLQEVLVTSDHAGPLLWKVTSGPHRLWILAEPPTPLRTDTVWSTKQVEAAIAGAQELILDGGICFNSRMSDSRLTAATYQDMRRFPGRLASLKDMVPDELYRRFEALKDAFAPRYDSMEQLRPWAAGFELNKHVMRSLGLSDTAVSDTPRRLGWKAKVITLYTYADYARFQKNSTSSRTVSCLEAIVSELEADRDDLPRLAGAWSVGDLETLQNVALRRQPDACVLDMFDNDRQAREVIARHSEYWLAAVDLALRTNETTFALVPAGEVFAPEGWLATLRARGYDVQGPRSIP
jgi:hypothetical protein